MNLIQVKILCIALTLEYHSVCRLKYGTRKYYIAILTNISVRLYRTMYFEVSANKLSNSLADLLLDEALRPMKEGLGSYITTVSDGWLTVGLQSITATRLTNHPGSQSLQLLLQECSNCTDFIMRI